MLERLLAVPVIMPPDLERSVKAVWSEVSNRTFILPPNGHPMKIMEDVSDLPSRVTRPNILPDVHLRFWVIDCQTMWAGQYRAIDEVFELLWPLFYWARFIGRHDLWFNKDPTEYVKKKDNSQGIIEIGRSYRRRIVSSHAEDHNASQHAGSGHNHSRSNPREVTLFRPWVLQMPYTSPGVRTYDRTQYQPLNDNAWRDGDEGLWDEEGAPVWVDPA